MKMEIRLLHHPGMTKALLDNGSNYLLNSTGAGSSTVVLCFVVGDHDLFVRWVWVVLDTFWYALIQFGVSS